MTGIYVSRPVINGGQIYNWAKESGFTNLVPAEKLHVTIAYSRVSPRYLRLDSNPLRVDFTGITKFGDCIVMELAGKRLIEGWQYYIDAGCSWDYPTYNPHITIAKNSDIPIWSEFQPAVILGPEVSEELNEDWS